MIVRNSMTIRLNEPAIVRARAETIARATRRELADATCPGLRLRLTPRGTATWGLACRDRDGRMRAFTIGQFPDLGVAQARDAARALRVEVKGGADPVRDRRQQRAAGAAAREGVGTLGAVIDLYGRHAGATLKSWPVARQGIAHVFAKLMQRPAATLTSAVLQMEGDRHPSASSAASAIRSLRPVLKWAAKRGYVPVEAAALTAATIKARHRTLTTDELRAILPALRASERPYGRAMLFMLLTLARREEVATATWGHVDLAAGTWLIPTTKNGQPHTVPLSRQAIELLRALRPIAPDPNGLVFVTARGAALGNWDRETKLIQVASRTADWTRHDLRRTGATMLGELGVTPDIVEAALNHTSIRSALAANYNRSRYRPQVAAALQMLADALVGIEQGYATVVPLHRPA